MRMLHIPALLLFSAACAAPPTHVEVTGASAPKAFVAGKPGSVTIKLKVPEGYHIYGPKEKAGVPIKVSLKGPKGFKATPSFPATTTFQGFEGPQQVYYGTVNVPVKIVGPKGVKGKTNLHFEVTYQACSDRLCLPPAMTKVDIVAEWR